MKHSESDNHDFHCLHCDEVFDVSEIAVDDNGDTVCPNCFSDDIVELGEQD